MYMYFVPWQKNNKIILNKPKLDFNTLHLCLRIQPQNNASSNGSQIGLDHPHG